MDGSSNSRCHESIEPWGPVECDGEMCTEGEVCVKPGEFCETYEPEETEVCPLYGCKEWEYPYSECASLPAECQGAPDLIECILDKLCDDNGCVSDNYFDAGKVTCAGRDCHCP